MLTEAERIFLIRRHPTIGEEMLAPSRTHPGAATGCGRRWRHHETVGGNRGGGGQGYPKGGEGEAITVEEA